MSRVNPRLFYWLAALLEHKDLTAGHYRVLSYLALKRLDYGSGAGYCSIASLANGLGVGVTVVKDALRLAQKAGLLEQTRRGHRLNDDASAASEWQILYPPNPTAAQASIGSADLNPTAAYPAVGSNPTAGNPEPNSRKSATQQPPERPPTGSESPTGNESPTDARPAGSRGQPAATPTDAAGVIRSKTDATAAEAAVIAAEWAARPGIRSAVAVLRSKTSSELQAEVRSHREANKPTPMPDGPPPRIAGAPPSERFKAAKAAIQAAAESARGGRQ